ncbi:MAG: aldo/keto reductase [Parvularculaceae bacterium]
MTAELGFGCSGAWALPVTPRAQAIRLVLRAIERGVRVFDTAPFYAGGEAERRLGAALKEAGSAAENIFICTKTGTQTDHLGRKRKDFSPAAIRADAERSLRSLGRERIDLLFLHGPAPEQTGSALSTLDALKREGKIAAAGVCGAGPELAHAVETGAIEAVMAPYNILHREHEPAFAAAKSAGMQTFAAAPLAQALYRAALFAPRSGADLWYLARAVAKNRAELARARRLSAAPVPEGWTRAQLALAYAAGSPHVDVAVVSTTRIAHLDEATAALEREAPPGALAAFLAMLDRGP